jgi:hypothetical protein
MAVARLRHEEKRDLNDFDRRSTVLYVKITIIWDF